MNTSGGSAGRRARSGRRVLVLCSTAALLSTAASAETPGPRAGVQLGAFSSAEGAERAVAIFIARDPALRGHLGVTQAVVRGKTFWRVGTMVPAPLPAPSPVTVSATGSSPTVPRQTPAPPADTPASPVLPARPMSNADDRRSRVPTAAFTMLIPNSGRSGPLLPPSPVVPESALLTMPGIANDRRNGIRLAAVSADNSTASDAPPPVVMLAAADAAAVVNVPGRPGSFNDDRAPATIGAPALPPAPVGADDAKKAKKTATASADVDAVSFDPSFFPSSSGARRDLARFEKAGYVPAGTYRADVHINDRWAGREDIVFKPVDGDANRVLPCFDATTLTRYGIDLAKVADFQKKDPSLKPLPADGQICGPIGDYIRDASSSFDMGIANLSFSIPQAVLARSGRGYVDPSQWNAGTNAVVLGYYGNIYSSAQRGQGTTTSAYLGLNGSLNIGSWHVYHAGTLNWTSGSKIRYDAAQTFAQHDLPALRSQIQLGQTYTQGDIFDSVGLTGVSFFSDDSMLPPSQRGFAPTIRGIASTNAKVTVYQRGAVIYETEVAPGAFAITDLYATGYSGDLDVKITEADGSTKWLKVPFSAVPRSLRTGQARWSLTGGQTRQPGLRDTPWLAQGSYSRGFSNLITGYGGVTVADNYWAVAGGVALNSPIGAFSADYTRTHARIGDLPGLSGGSLRIAYSKNVTATGTNFSLATYRYASTGYVGLNDLLIMRNVAARDGSATQYVRERNRYNLTVNQRLPQGWGQLYGSGSVINYWGRGGTNMSFSAGYNNSWRGIGYGVSAQRAWVGGVDGATRPVTTVMLNLSMALGRSTKSPMVSGSYSYADQGGGSGGQVSITGLAGSRNEFTYGANASSQLGNTSFGLGGGYRSSIGQVNATYSHGASYDSFGGSVQGSLVIHGGGVTLGQGYAPGIPIGLVHAPDAGGASISEFNQVRVNGNGYAIVPNLVAYQLNTLTLDTRNTDPALELDTSQLSVAPRAGAVTKLDFKTRLGRAVMVTSQMPDGGPLPFGAEVIDSKGINVGTVGQASRLILTGLIASDTVTVRWGDEAGQSCRIKIDLPARAKHASHDGFEELTAPCAPGPDAPPASANAPAPRVVPPAPIAPATAPAPQPRPPAPSAPAAAPAKAAPAPAPARPASSGRVRVMVGSFHSEADAVAGWRQIAARVPEITRYTRSITPAQVNGRTWYRLGASGGDAAALTAKLKAAGLPFYMMVG